jgi:hypothetical protein
MRIDSSVVFFLLERDFTLRYPRKNQAGPTVERPRLLENSRPEPGFLYIVGKIEFLDGIREPVSAAFLLCDAAAEHLADLDITAELPPWLAAADAACVEGATSLELLDRVVSLFFALQDWDNRLKDACLGGSRDYGPIFRISREFFDLPFGLVDRNFAIIAHTTDFVPDDGEANKNRVPMEAVNEMLVDDGDKYYASSEFVEPYIYPSTTAQVAQWLCCNIFRGDHFEGRITAVLNRKENHPGRSQLLALFCRHVAKIFLCSADELLVRTQDDPLHRLVRDSILSPETVAEQNAAPVLAELAWRMEDSYFLAMFELTDERRLAHGALYICRHLESNTPHSCAALCEARIIWLVNTTKTAPDNQKRDHRQAIASIAREFNCKTGISKPFAGFIELRTAWLQADAALRLGHKRDPHLWVYDFSGYTLDYVLERAASEIPAESLLHPAVITLRELDNSTGSSYVKTLRYYLDCRYEANRAAEKLYIHRTTLIRRLERISEITGLDLDRPGELMTLAISLCLLAEGDAAKTGP